MNNELEKIVTIDLSKIEHYEELLMGFCMIDKKYRLCEESHE